MSHYHHGGSGYSRHGGPVSSTIGLALVIPLRVGCTGGCIKWFVIALILLYIIGLFR